jgi:hypothetical protein
VSEEEKDNEVVDEHDVKPEDEAPVEGEAPAEPSDEPDLEDFAAALPPVDVYTLIRSFIGLLGAQAWQWMGLVKNPSTGQIEKDLVQAKVAIDTVAALIAQTEGKLSSPEAEELRAMLSDLRINFVRQS